MPESAEVKITAEYLNRVLGNQIITDWVFLSGQYQNKDPSGFDQFYQHLPYYVAEVGCKGKLIYLHCFNEYRHFYILHSMRMTGSWRNEPDDQCRWYVELYNGQKYWFRDPRCLATLQFTPDEDVFQQALDKLGPDILTEQFTLEAWAKMRTRHKNKNITAFLMNQNILSGVGNYIKAEALYHAGISPLRKVGSLTEEEADKLYEGIRLIPRLAYNYKGLSIRDYADPEGRKGQQQFHLHIYGQPHATKTNTPDGRTTHWDPNKQK